MKKRRIKLLLLLLLFPLAFSASVWAYHFRPIIETKTWEAVATGRNGVALPSKCYRMLGRPGLIFINVPDAADLGHRWFAILPDGRHIMVSWPVRSPYLNFRHDQALGIQLGDAKLEEHWEIDWAGEKVSFKSPGIAVTASPKDL